LRRSGEDWINRRINGERYGAGPIGKGVCRYGMKRDDEIGHLQSDIVTLAELEIISNPGYRDLVCAGNRGYGRRPCKWLCPGLYRPRPEYVMRLEHTATTENLPNKGVGPTEQLLVQVSGLILCGPIRRAIVSRLSTAP